MTTLIIICIVLGGLWLSHARGWWPWMVAAAPASSTVSPSVVDQGTISTSNTANQNAAPTPIPTTSAVTPAPPPLNAPDETSDVSSPAAAIDSQATPTPLSGGGMVSINFDDGFASAFKNGLPIIDQAGLKSTWYIITDFLGKKNYVTAANVLQLAREGHEVGAHTRTHPHLTQIPATQMRDEIDGSRDDLIALGIHPQTFAYPYGDYNAAVADTVKSAGFVGARITHPGLDGANAAAFALLDHGVDANTTFAQAAQWIDDARAKKLWLIITFHRIDETGNSISAPHTLLYQIVQYIKNKKIRVVTTAEGLHRILDK